MKIFDDIVFIYFALILIPASCVHRPLEESQNGPPKYIGLNDTILKDINPHILIGSPIQISDKNDKYLNICKTEFNSGQSLWYARWNGWVGAGNYNFAELNRNINWMYENKLSPQVHMLVGPDMYMPDWLINGNWQQSELDSLLQNIIYSIMDANDNKDKVDIWNVINELFDEDGMYRTDMVWRKLGMETDSSGLTGENKINDQHPLFIRKAFTYCREKTHKKLELRDYNIESNNPSCHNYKKNIAFYQLLKHMLNAHIPIDAVGIQGHLAVSQTTNPTNWMLDNNALKETVQKFKALGLEVYITELDVRIENRTWTEELAQEQKNIYYNYIKQAIEGGATRINFWGFQDGNDKGWITTEHPLPWDENLNRKPAYFGVKQALNETK